MNKLYAERQPPRIVQLFTPTTGDDHEPADPMPTKPGSKRKTKKTDTSATSLEDHIAKRHADAKAKQESRFDTMPSRPIAQACRNTSSPLASVARARPARVPGAVPGDPFAAERQRPIIDPIKLQ